jgi:hypothetical protein
MPGHEISKVSVLLYLLHTDTTETTSENLCLRVAAVAAAAPAFHEAEVVVDARRLLEALDAHDARWVGAYSWVV